jgi:hypothetical protein
MTPTRSPLTKKPRLTTSTPVKKTLFTDVDEESRDGACQQMDDLQHDDVDARDSDVDDGEAGGDNDLSVDLAHMSIIDEDGEYVQELINLIPSVLENIKEVNQTKTFMKFNRLVANNDFPLRNIAYVLFLDIVK